MKNNKKVDIKKYNIGVYEIENKNTNIKYIGSSSNLYNRKNKHFSNLKHNCHPNKHLQNSYNIYGKNYFIFNVLLYCSIDNLIFYEQKIINTYDLKNELYNKRINAKTNIGFKHTDETKKKLKFFFTGRKFSKDHRNKISQSLKNKKKTKEHIKKILETKKKKGFPKPMLNKTLSSETKEKIRQARKKQIITKSRTNKWTEKSMER